MDIFIYSDPHFSHANFLKFKNDAEQFIRPFPTIEDMDNLMIENHNALVKPTDKVYCLGDVTMHKRYLSIVDKLHGKKKLILGNHDIFDLKDYAKHFDTIYAMRTLPEFKLQLTHIPLHIDSVKRGWINVHGHIHAKVINHANTMVDGDLSIQHPRYYNACVEQHNYTPVPIDVILDKVKALAI
jgi:calcineurin-like phosphoesterase family protein